MQAAHVGRRARADEDVGLLECFEPASLQARQFGLTIKDVGSFNGMWFAVLERPQ